MINITSSATLYVSATEGNDNYSGFAPHPIAGAAGCIAGPLRTLRRAKMLLEEMCVPTKAQPVTLRIEGDHFMTAPLTLSPAAHYAQAGYALANITIESYGATRARLIGGRRIEGLAPDTFRGVACLSAHIPDVASGAWQFTDLYVNGRRAQAARYPREGTLRALAVERESGPSAWQHLHDGSRWFIADKRDLADVEGIENATVSFYHYWVDEHSPVESYDRESGKLVMSYRSRYKNSVQYDLGATSELCYYLENVPNAFGRPNDWYLDVPNGMLYYVPEDMTADPTTLEVLAPTLTQLVTVSGAAGAPATGIRLRNLDFICSRGDYASKSVDPSDAPVPVPTPEGYASDPQAAADAYGAVQFRYAENCAVEGCRFTALGLHAVEILGGCRRIRVERSSFEQLGGSAVKIFGAPAEGEPQDMTSHCSVIGNTVRHIGRRYAAAVGILVCHASYNEIADNEVAYTDYSGISVGWVWGYKPSSCYGNIIRRNHVHHIGMGQLSDLAGIYLLGVQSGTVVEENHVHDVISAYYSGHGIYTDEGSSYITIERNLVTHCTSSCFFQHYGAYNTVRDNLFAFGKGGVISVGTVKTGGHIGIVFEGNTVITEGDDPIYAVGNPGLLAGVLRASRNFFLHTDGHAPVLCLAKVEGGTRPLSLADWQSATGLDEESVCTPPDALAVNARLDAFLKK